MTTAPVIHGHFHQPPRENSRTETVERGPGPGATRGATALTNS
ncbi:MAG TPA: hypothetical protein VF668_03560 [Pyrinomonadaceae bacterium]|jgi:alpha-amylase/alpha-mannosidase (GH57 family)